MISHTSPLASNVAQHYAKTTQSLAAGKPEGGKPATETSALAKGVESFSKVMEGVETAASGMAQGTADPQSVVQALAQADVALEAAVTVRNRVVEAYQEILRMPI